MSFRNHRRSVGRTRRLRAESLEERILFSGDSLASFADFAATEPAESAIESTARVTKRKLASSETAVQPSSTSAPTDSQASEEPLVGEGSTIVLQGKLPQRLILRDRNGTAALDQWCYSREVPLGELPPGVYRLQVAPSSAPWWRGWLEIGEQDLQLRHDGSRFVELDGEFPRRMTVLDQTRAMILDHYVYQNPVVVDQLFAGQYELRHAASGENWQQEVLELSPDRVALDPLVEKELSFSDSLPRWIEVATAEGDVVQRGWHYSDLLDMHQFDSGTYLVRYARSGADPTVLRVDIEGLRFSVQDVTPPSRVITLSGEFPTQLEIYDASGHPLETREVHSPRVSLAAYADGDLPVELMVVQWNGEPEAEAVAMHVRLTDEGIEASPLVPVKLDIDGPADVSIYNDRGQLVHRVDAVGPFLDLRFLADGAYQLVYQTQGIRGTVRVQMQDSVPAAADVSADVGVLPLVGEPDFEIWITDADGRSIDIEPAARPEIYLGFLPLGQYEIRYASSDANARTFQVNVAESGTSVSDITAERMSIELDAKYPLYVTVIGSSGETLTANWHYSDRLDLRDYGAGDFLVYFTDGGNLNKAAAVHADLFRATATYFSVDRYVHQSLNARSGQVGLDLAMESGYDAFEIINVPQHGQLLTGNSDQYQTYLANTGFVGFDWFIYRAYRDGYWEEPRLIRIDVFPQEPSSLSYFVPAHGTVGMSQGMPAVQERLGGELPTDLVVVNEYGPSIDRYDRQGNLQWRYIMPVGLPSVAEAGNELVFAQGRTIGFLDSADGRLLRLWDVADDTTWVRFVNPVADNRFLIGRETTAGSFEIELRSADGQLLWRNPIPVLYPRWADLSGDRVVIADTFNHRIFGIDIDDDRIQFEVPVFFPNDVRFVDPNRLLIAEEHADRVWFLDLADLGRTLLLAAPGWEDLSLSIEELQAKASDVDQRMEPSNALSKSKSALEFSGSQTLYSPNGAIAAGEQGVYIADTDNHRVVYVSLDGLVLGELRGLNNPTKLVSLPTRMD